MSTGRYDDNFFQQAKVYIKICDEIKCPVFLDRTDVLPTCTKFSEYAERKQNRKM